MLQAEDSRQRRWDSKRKKYETMNRAKLGGVRVIPHYTVPRLYVTCPRKNNLQQNPLALWIRMKFLGIADSTIVGAWVLDESKPINGANRCPEHKRYR